MSKKITTTEVGIILMAVGQVMINSDGVIAGAIIGPNRDKLSDDEVFSQVQELDEEMTHERMSEILDIEFSELESTGV